ncbi:dihydrofolate reductase family protein [Taibaiella koreensis]|uniref:dihydrofolate reductase family protein n=1 Tax=Taibaiella koreensis TaxID=1268548 RepID=UPI000E59D8A4|nr:dihydrofolate reductase family protein [Taibaiella koreensis]
MSKIIATVWMSLDGIFDATLMAEWFNPYHSDSRAARITQNIQDCDAMLYGRKTYEMLYPYWSSLKNNEMGVADKLNQTKKYVVSDTLKTAPWENTTILGEDFVARLKDIKANGTGNILVQGSGELVNSLIAEGLLDELRVMLHPHIMGRGQRFFKEGVLSGLERKAISELDLGVLEITYAPVA